VTLTKDPDYLMFTDMRTTTLQIILTNFTLSLHLALAFKKIDEVHDAEANQMLDIELIQGSVIITSCTRKQMKFTGKLSEQSEGYEYSTSGFLTATARASLAVWMTVTGLNWTFPCRKTVRCGWKASMSTW